MFVFEPDSGRHPLDTSLKIGMLDHQNGRLQITQQGGWICRPILKCRTKREMRNPQQVTLKNGRPATPGACPVCGTKMYRIGKG
jgi:hypothetical protein